MTLLQVFRDLRASAFPQEKVEIDDSLPLKAHMLISPDISDPLNQIVSVGFKIADAIGVNATVEWHNGDYSSPEFRTALRAVLLYAIDNAAELRDLLKANR